jgi:hypothetical protein
MLLLQSPAVACVLFALLLMELHASWFLFPSFGWCLAFPDILSFLLRLTSHFCACCCWIFFAVAVVFLVLPATTSASAIAVAAISAAAGVSVVAATITAPAGVPDLLAVVDVFAAPDLLTVNGFSTH